MHSALLRPTGLAFALALAGCVGSRGDLDLVEARLRDQQDLVARYQKVIDSTQTELSLARREADILRTQLANAGKSPLLPEQADVLLRAEQLAFHSMMTGARDVDGQPGDDVINVVVAPQAHEGETIRLIGELEIEALDLSRPEGEQRIGRWEFTPEQARELWHNGFLASGYQADLPWQDVPSSSEVLLHARLKTADGRQLDASHTIVVDVPGAIQTASLNVEQPRTEPGRLRPGLAQPILSEAAPPLDAPPLAPGYDSEVDEEPPVAANAVAAAPAAPPPFPDLNATKPDRRAAPASTGSPESARLAANVMQPVIRPSESVRKAAQTDASPAEDLPVIIPRPFPQRTIDSEPAGTARAVLSEAGPFEPLSELPRTRRDASTAEPRAMAPSTGSEQATLRPTFPVEIDPGPREEAPPFPLEAQQSAPLPAVRTSDVWTDESIPYLR